MLLWFLGTVTLIVLAVFRDPRFDYRLLLVGALVPDVVDGVMVLVSDDVLVVHSVLTAVLTLVVVMVATVGRRRARSTWLALPIGMFLHLVVDGAVDDASMFWWPLGGWTFDGAELPVVARGWVNVPLELAGLVMCAIVWRRFHLADPGRRRWFLRTGQLVPTVPSTTAPPTC